MALLLASLYGCGEKNDRARYTYERAKGLYNERRLEEALTLFEKSIAQNRRIKQAYVMAAKCDYFLGREREAQATLGRVLDIYPGYVEANYWSGKIFYFMEEYEKAEERLLAAVEEDGAHCDARFLLGEIYRLEGSYEKALLNYQLVEAVLDTVSLSKIRIGEIYVSSKQYQRALEKISFIERNKEELDIEVLGEAYALLSRIPAIK